MSDAKLTDEEVDALFDVTDVRYNPIGAFGDLIRPLGLESGLLIRVLRGGVLVLDVVSGQVYEPVSGRLAD